MTIHYHLLSALMIISLCLSQSMQAQVVKDWDYRYGGSNADKLTDYNLVTSAWGAYFFGGSSESPISGDKTSQFHGNNDYWIVRANSNGNYLIDYSFGGLDDDYLTVIQALGADEFFLGGYSYSDDDGTKSATQIGTGNTTSDFWVTKVHDSGSSLTPLWDKAYGSTEEDQLHDIIQAHNGNYILAGFTKGSANNDVTGTSNGGSDYWIVEINPSGNVQWDRMYSGDKNDELYTIIPTSDGGYLLGGKSQSDITLGHKTADAHGDYDFWVIKIDAVGNIMWDKTIGGLNTDVLKSIHENADGSFMLAGWSNSGVSGNKTTATNGTFDYWLVKIDAVGNILWDKSYGGSNSDYAYEIIQSNDGNFVLAGKSASDAGGDKSENSQGTFDYWILGIDVNGNPIWDKTFGGDNSEDLRKIYEVADNEFVLIGSSSSSASGDKSQGNQSMAAASNDYWILKSKTDSTYIDSLALIEIYDSLGGDSWTDNTNWKTSNPISTWFGVSVNGSGRVDSLNLDGNNLSDTIPASINNLSHLTYINFQSNSITGPIPFLNLFYLKKLALSGNSIGGSLQDYDLPQLEIINIGSNNISGAIPNFSNMNRLTQIYFHNNNLNSLPALALPNLSLLRVSSNELTGSIPDLTSSPSIVNLNLSDNQLSGTIPSFLNSMPNLQYLHLYKNNLSGDVPDFTGLILSTFRIEENNLENMPDASHMISLGNTSSNGGLQMDNNAFTFEDIIVNAQNIASTSITYAPQDSIGVDSTISLTINDPLNINLEIDDTVTTNVYTWFKDGNIVSTTNSALFTISVVTLSDEGTYTCQVTNPNAPNLTLQSRSYMVSVLNPLEVTNTNDTGTGSLREAITYANNHAGNDTITFNISGGTAPYIIQPINDLPSLTDAGTVINGTSQPSYTDGDIQLNGQFSLINGFTIIGNNCAIYGFYIYHYNEAGIKIDGGQNVLIGNVSTKNFIAGNDGPGIHLLNGANWSTLQGNYCGIAADLSVFPNDVGILIENSDNVTIDNNIMSGNANSGIEIDSSDNLTITSNKIGVEPDGTTAASNGSNGITITGNSTNITIGGSGANDPNIIAYNNTNGYGVSLNNDAFNVTISQNQVYCNNQGGIQLNDNANSIQGMPTILKATNSTISGIATSNAVIEIFENDNSNCTGITSCQGKTYLGSATADGTGAWSKSGSFTIGTEISTTATDPTNGTSNFSSCITVVASCAYTDSLALVELYDSTNGANWTNTWDLNQPIDTWYGVTLNGSGCVEILDLDGDPSDGALAGSGNNLVGTLPDLNLANATEIYLSNNQLTGDIPNFTNLTSIFKLYLFGNNFSNTALPDFSNISSLNDLDLSNNNLSGTIPDFSVLGGLSRLNLASNNFSGTVPDFAISILTKLYLDNNQLDSCPNFSGLLSLSNLFIKNNKFTFDDIVPNVGKPTNIYDYIPQDSTGTIRIETITLGNPYTIELGFDNGVTNSTYSWFKDGNFITTTSTNKYTITNATLADEGQYDVQVTNTDASGLTLNVRPITLTTCPVVNMGQDTAICSGASLTLDAENTGATYLWSTLETTQTITVTPSISTTYEVTVTSPSGCTVADTIIVTVNDLPTAAVSGAKDICLNTTTTLNGNPSGGSNMYTNHDWAFLTGSGTVTLANNLDGTVDVTGTNTGMVTLEYKVTDSNGCEFVTTYSFNVNNLPTAAVSGATEICLNETTTLNGNPSGGSGTFTTHTWSVLTGTGTVTWTNNNDGTVDVTGTGAGIVTLEYQVTDDKGCSFTTTYNLTINNLPTAAISGAMEICLNETTTLNGNPSGGSGTFTTHTWSVLTGTGTVTWTNNNDGTVDVTGTGAGIVTLEYQVTDDKGCSFTTTYNLTINNLPTATISGATEICLNETTTLNGNPSGGSGTFTTHTWSVLTGTGAVTWTNNNDGTVDVTGTGAGIVTLEYQVTDDKGCSFTTTYNLTINNLPTATISGATEICLNETTTLNGNPSGGSGTFTTHTWSVLTGTGTATLTNNLDGTVGVTGTGAGIITLEYQVTDDKGCEFTTTYNLTVNNLPTAAVSGATEICLNETTTLNGNPSGGSGTFTTHTWSVLTGTGTVTWTNNNDGTVDVAGTGAGIVTLEYQVTDDKGCSFTTTYNVTVNNLPTAAVSGATEICLNETTTLNGNPSGGSGTFTTHTWSVLTGTGMVTWTNNNDGTVDITGTGAGIVTLEYQVTDDKGCEFTTTYNLTINNLPTAAVSGATEICLNETTTLNGNPSGGSGTFTTHTWSVLTGTGTVTWTNNNDGTVDVTGTGAGIVTLEYQVTDDKGCSFTTTYNLTINDLPTITMGNDTTVIAASPSFNLTANPSGGTWSGVGVTNNTLGTFDPAVSGTGVFRPNYTITDGTGCINVDSLQVIVGAITCAHTDSLALVDLYNATNGLNWTNTWDLAQPMTTWYGVFINTASGCVDSVKLQNNNLVGTALPDLDLDNIITLSLDSNQISGSIPNFSQMPNLEILALGQNNFSTTIPNFNSLSNLQILRLDGNTLSGTIPDFNLPLLETMILYDNQLTTIPNFSSLPKLKSILAYNNNFAHTMPLFDNLPNLENLSLYNNQLTGAIPDFANSPNLQYIAIQKNNLTSIPNFNLTNLKSLFIGYNELTDLPTFTNLTSLEVWDVANNQLTFEDIEPNLGIASTAYVYAPQDSVGTATTTTVTSSTDYTINHLGIDNSVSTNTYYWYLNGVLIDSTITNQYTITNFSAADAGTYHATVKNSNATALTLNSRGITLSVIGLTIQTCRGDTTLSTAAGLCTQQVDWSATEPTAVDQNNNPVAYSSRSHTPNSSFNKGVTTVTYIFGNEPDTVSCSFNIIINDEEKPSINCPNDTIIDTDIDLCYTVFNFITPTATDNCAIDSIRSSHNMGDTLFLGTTTVQYIAVDSSGNQDTCSFNVTVVDNEKPTFANCPTDTTIFTGIGTCTATFNWTEPTATDNCGTPTITRSHAPNSTFTVNTTTTVQYIAEDGNGKRDTCSFNVTVLDSEKPVFSNCPTDTTIFNDVGTCAAIFNWTTPTATDNCGTPTVSSSHTSGSSFNVNTTTTVQYIAEDANGNRDTCFFNITVLDNEKPVFTNCPNDTTLFNDVGNCFATFNWTTPTATDNCGTPTISSSHTSGSTFAVNTTTTIMHIAEDANGNRDTCTFNVTVLDNEKPTFSNCPTDITLNNEAGQCYAIPTWTAPTVNDNCGTPIVTNTHTSGDTFYIGTTTPVLYIAEDANGNRDTCKFNVTILDNEPPIMVCPNDLTIYSDPNSCAAIATWTTPTATDNCDPSPTITSSNNSGDSFAVGAHIVKYTFNDANGNIDSCEFMITVLDTIKPIFGNIPMDTITSCETMVSWSVPTASDSCGIASLTSSHNPNDVFPIGTTDVTYTATDVNGNNNTITFKVIVYPPVDLSINGSDVSCFGANDGQATVTPINGAAPYTYLWNNAATTTTITNLTAATYSITATDANSCIDSAMVTINTPDSIAVTMTKLLDVSCNGGNNGSAAAIVTGGIGGFSYFWSNGEFTAQTNTLTAGWHFVTVTDATGCIAIDSIEINEPVAITATIQQINPVQCAGQSNGSAEVQPIGGNTPYTYLWDNGETTDTAIALNAGLHTVTVTDATGCTATFTVTITEPNPLQVTQAVVVSLVSCNGGNDGVGTFTVTGGTAPYSYNWSDGTTTDTAFALTMGAHQVTITDANGCIIGGSLLMNGPTALTGSITVDVPLTCNGNINGEVTATISGGNTPYTYQWNTTPIQTTATATGLGAGTHTITVSDANNCTFVDSIELTTPNLLSVTVISQDDSCGRGIGVLSLNVGGGMTPYTYAWGGTLSGQTTAAVSDLVSDTYPVTVSDANGCTSVNNYFINNVCDSCSLFEPLAFSNNIPYTYLCLGNDEAEVLINVEGGKPEFDLNNGSSSNYTYTLTGSSLTADGTYTDPTGVFSFMVKAGDNWSISIDDDLGCGLIATNGTFTESVANCNNYCNLYPIQTRTIPSDQDTIVLINNDVPISVIVTNPDSLQNYTYTWSPTNTLSCSNCSDPIASPNRSTRYDVVTMNDSGCVRIDTILIQVALTPDAESFLTVPKGITANNDGFNDVFIIDGLELFPKNELIVINRWGNVVYTAKPYQNNWRGTFQGTTLPEGTYYYILRTDLANSETLKGSILIIR